MNAKTLEQQLAGWIEVRDFWTAAEALGIKISKIPGRIAAAEARIAEIVAELEKVGA